MNDKGPGVMPGPLLWVSYDPSCHPDYSTVHEKEQNRVTFPYSLTRIAAICYTYNCNTLHFLTD